MLGSFRAAVAEGAAGSVVVFRCAARPKRVSSKPLVRQDGFGKVGFIRRP